MPTVTWTLCISRGEFAANLNIDEVAARAVFDAAWDNLDIDDLPITRLDRDWSSDGFCPSARVEGFGSFPADEDREIRDEILARWARAVEAATPPARVVEYMPLYLRASHTAAGNSGSYPANGAVRVLVGATEDVYEDEWTVVVRPATSADLSRYANATESDYNAGMGG